MATKTYRGSCHCGRIKFEAEIDLAAGTTKCNCTSCWKKRLWTTRVKPESFRQLQGQEEMSETKAGHGFCKHCGVITFNRVAKADWNDGEYVSVSVASLDNLEPAELLAAPVQYCDGLANNWWHPPAETRYL
jgi:hypothetical protein